MKLSLFASADGFHPVPNHSNILPFKGILTVANMPSDMPFKGTLGKKLIIPRYVLEQAMPTLLGMAVNFDASLEKHNVRNKCGLITNAELDGDICRIGGFIYHFDFPEFAGIAMRNELGFSFEAHGVSILNMSHAILVATGIQFTGATIALKSKVAYSTYTDFKLIEN